MRLRVAREAHDAMVAHARAERPDECCGLLLATGDLIDASVPARNLLASQTRFRVDPADHFAAIRPARSTGGGRGAYHSHPRGPSTPSPTDAAEVNDPSLLYVIVSLARGAADRRRVRVARRELRGIDLVPVP